MIQCKEIRYDEVRGHCGSTRSHVRPLALGALLALAACGDSTPARAPVREPSEEPERAPLASSEAETAGTPVAATPPSEPLPVGAMSADPPPLLQDTPVAKPPPACECAVSDALQAIGCGSGTAYRHLPAISDDGQTIAFDACPDNGVCRVLRWTADGGLQTIASSSLGSGMGALSPDGQLVVISPNADTFGAEALLYRASDASRTPTGLRPEPVTLAADGSVMGLAFDTPSVQLARWRPGTGRELLGELPDADRYTLVSSPDVPVLFGASENPGGTEPFRWTPQQGLVQGLAGVPLLNTYSPLTLSRDGSTLLGHGPSGPFRWTEAAGAAELGLPGESEGYQMVVSSDGSVLATSQRVNPIVSCGPNVLCTGAFRRTEASGSLELTPGTPSIATAISSDGTRVLGVAGTHETSVFEWTSGRSARNLQLALEAAGVDATGWKLIAANALSRDGKVLVGQAYCGGTFTVVRVELPD